jgi:CDP-diacylglycerol---serine O-phosphatidyltransferase
MGPQPQGKPPRRAAYALPTLFTSGNIFLGFVAIVQAFEGALQISDGDYRSNPHFSLAAKALGWAVFLDGLDGRIARMTNTTSDFGRELDSLADVITFGIAPAVLAFVWGVLFVVGSADLQSNLSRAGYLVTFFYLLCGAVRLARFNIQSNPAPRTAGRSDRRYFIGMPIPAAAGFVAAIVFIDDAPLRSYTASILWLIALGVVGLLMVSTWRYPSFKQIGITKPRTPLIALIIGGVAFLVWEWPQPVLLAAACAYVASGIAIRIVSFLRRRKKPRPPAVVAEHQIG